MTKYIRNQQATCKTCLYWETEKESKDNPGTFIGYCVKYPPQIFYDTAEDDISSGFPQTHESRVCGEHPDFLIEEVEPGSGDNKRLKVIDD